VLPDLVVTQFHRSVYGLVSRYIKHSKLRQVFSFHPLLVGGNPFTTTAVYALISHLERRFGVHYTIGGTGRLVSGLVELIEGQGGSLRCDSEVAEILVTDGAASGVRLKNGEHIAADIVVSNADSAMTYRELLPAKYRKRWTDRKIKRSRYSMSLFVWYFGTDRQYPDVPHHMILLNNRYRSLLKDIFEDCKLTDDFSLYLHRPTASDPSLAPDGCDTFYVLAPVPHLDADVDWETQAEPYRQLIETSLADTVLPELDQHVVTSCVRSRAQPSACSRYSCRQDGFVRTIAAKKWTTCIWWVQGRIRVPVFQVCCPQPRCSMRSCLIRVSLRPDVYRRQPVCPRSQPWGLQRPDGQCLLPDTSLELCCGFPVA
jgi:phytoene desaturase